MNLLLSDLQIHTGRFIYFLFIIGIVFILYIDVVTTDARTSMVVACHGIDGKNTVTNMRVRGVS